MKFYILDVYKDRHFRVSKDTNGGYGTANDFGKDPVTALLSRIKKKTTDFPPLVVSYMVSALRSQGHTVSYGKNKYPDRDADVVILVSSIVEHSTEIEWGHRLKEAGFYVGYVGPFAGILSKEYLGAGDFVIIGEPEFLFLKPITKEKLKGIVRADADLRPLDELPFPEWDFLNLASLKYSLYGSGGGRFFPMLASRGCPYPCSYYCTYPIQQGKAVRSRSAKNIVDEMELLKNKYQAKTIMFRDPIFTFDRKRTLAFAEELIGRDLGMRFIIETHLASLDGELIEKLRKAGLIVVKVGIESAAGEVLEGSHRKEIKKDLQADIIRKLEKAGIGVICFYILAFPDDTWDSCLATIEYAKRLNTAGAQFSVCTPYPGTSFYEEVKGSIIAKSFDDFTQFNLVYKHKNLTFDQVEKLKNIAYSGYYLRIPWIIKYLKMKFKANV